MQFATPLSSDSHESEPGPLAPPVRQDSGYKRLAKVLAKTMLVPDPQILWCFAAARAARRLVAERGIDVIYSSSPPESSHLLGLWLKKRTGKPWVMDLRDPWTHEPLRQALRKPGLRTTAEKWLERRCLAGADAVIFNTPESTAVHSAMYPEFKSKFETITNGFDEEEFSEHGAKAGERAEYGNQFVVAHVGTFFRSEAADPVPRDLLRALRRLVDDGVLEPATSRVILAGRLDPRVKQNVDELGLAGLVEMPGTLCHTEAVELMKNADLLLVYDAEQAGGSYVRGKVYEYLASSRAVLGVLPEGATRNLLREAGVSALAYPADEGRIAELIAESKAKSSPRVSPPGFDLARYSRRSLTEKLVRCFDALTR
jgi:glycosyltransferase involved in cell wall biosynthesis